MRCLCVTHKLRIKRQSLCFLQVFIKINMMYTKLFLICNPVNSFIKIMWFSVLWSKLLYHLLFIKWCQTITNYIGSFGRTYWKFFCYIAVWKHNTKQIFQFFIAIIGWLFHNCPNTAIYLYLSYIIFKVARVVNLKLVFTD